MLTSQVLCQTMWSDQKRRSDQKPWFAVSMLIAVFVLGGCAARVPYEYDSAERIEFRYSLPGQYDVVRIELSDKNSQAQYAAYLPTESKGQHPLVIWQNGTGVDIETYDAIARHLATWGIVVLGSYDKQMASGQSAIASLRHVERWTADRRHPLYQRIYQSRIAMAGSSQGAVGAINAHTRFRKGRSIRTLAIHGTPTAQAIKFFGLDFDYDASTVSVPIFIMTGTEDEFISPIAWNEAIFDSLKGSALRVMGVSTDADHIEFADDAGRMRGYLTAWLTFQLLGDAVAAKAFIGPAEITTNPDWTPVRIKN